MSDFVRKTYRKEIKDDTKIDLEPRRGDIVLSGEEIVGVVMANGTYKELANQSALIYEISESDKRHDKDVAEINDRLTALEEKPAGATPTITFTGSPLQLGTGIQTLTYFDSITGETSEMAINIVDSNWGDDTPVKSLFLIEDTYMKGMEVTTFRIVGSEGTLPIQDFTVEGVLSYSTPTQISMTINIIKGVTEAP